MFYLFKFEVTCLLRMTSNQLEYIPIFIFVFLPFLSYDRRSSYSMTISLNLFLTVPYLFLTLVFKQYILQDFNTTTTNATSGFFFPPYLHDSQPLICCF